MAARRTQKQELERNIERYMKEQEEIEAAARLDDFYYDRERAAYEDYKARQKWQEKDLSLPDCNDAVIWDSLGWDDDYWDYDWDDEDW